MEIDLSRSVVWNCWFFVAGNIIIPSFFYRRNCVFLRFCDGVACQDEIE